MKSLRTLLLAGMVLVFGAVAVAAQGNTVTCKDGTKSKGGQGACSSHGGVTTAAEMKAAKMEAKADKAAKGSAMAAKAEAKEDKAAMKGGMKSAKAEAKEDKAAAMGGMKAEAKEDKAAAKGGMKAAKSEAKEDNEAAGAMAQCKDGMYSHAKTHRGACSRHGGVAKFLDGKAK